jgi:hypothetical protein
MKRQRFLHLSALLCLSGSFLLVRENSLPVPSHPEKSVSQPTTGKRIPRIQIDTRSTILAQAGGMTGGMGGMGGMMMVPIPQAQPLVIWNKPEVSPKWLERGRKSMRKFEDTRDALEQEWKADYSQMPLSAVVKNINEQLREVGKNFNEEPKVTLELNLEELENAGQSPETPVTLEANGPLRLVLKRMLEPLGCDYIVQEGYLEITSIDDARVLTNLRTYDLTTILPNNSHSDDLMRVIENSISPDKWESGDASMAIFGSVMVVRASEGIHLEVEQLLSSLTDVKLSEPDIVQTSPDSLPTEENTKAEKLPPLSPPSVLLPGNALPPANSPTENEKEAIKKKEDGKTVQYFRPRSNSVIIS